MLSRKFGFAALIGVQTASAFGIFAIHREPALQLCSFFSTSVAHELRLIRKDSSLNSAPRSRPILKMNAENMAKPGVLNGLVLAITGNFDKDRDSVVKLMKDLGATESSTVHKRVNFLITDDGAVASRTKHVRKAVKYGVKIVSAGYLNACAENKARVDFSPYIYNVQISRSDDDLTDE